MLERLAFAPIGGPARTSEGCFSETRPGPLASLPVCLNSISALICLQVYYYQNPGFGIHLVHWVLVRCILSYDILGLEMETP